MDILNTFASKAEHYVIICVQVAVKEMFARCIN